MDKITPEEFDNALSSGADSPELWAIAALTAMVADADEKLKWFDLFTEISGGST